MADASSTLAAKREIAFYGGEEGIVTPEEEVSGAEAEKAVEAGKEIYSRCMELLSAYTSQGEEGEKP